MKLRQLLTLLAAKQVRFSAIGGVALIARGVQRSTEDLDIAYALLLADRQWGSSGAIDYRSEAARIARAIVRSETEAERRYVLLGDWVTPGDPQYYTATRSSDFMPGHFDSFAEVLGDDSWNRLRDGGYQIFAALQRDVSPKTGLIPDFIRGPVERPTPVEPGFLEREVDGEYSFNACRVPFRLGVHYLVTGDDRAREALQKINAWLREKTGGDPSLITAGYWLDGDSLPRSEYTDMSFVSPFGVGAMVDAANQDWVDALWEAVRWSPGGSYYGDTLRVLSMIAMSGNWWAPDAVPCPTSSGG